MAEEKAKWECTENMGDLVFSYGRKGRSEYYGWRKKKKQNYILRLVNFYDY